MPCLQGPKEGVRSPGTGLAMVVSHLENQTQILSERADSDLNHQAISLPHSDCF